MNRTRFIVIGSIDSPRRAGLLSRKGIAEKGAKKALEEGGAFAGIVVEIQVLMGELKGKR